jgi:hypothetical protein
LSPSRETTPLITPPFTAECVALQRGTTNYFNVMIIIETRGNLPYHDNTTTDGNINEYRKKYLIENIITSRTIRNKGNNKITELRTILQRESPNS